MKIVITGSRGQLGSELIKILKNGYSEIGQIDDQYKNCEIISTNSDQLDISNCENVKNFLIEKKPDVVINCAAMTNVDACETNLEGAMKVNALGPLNIAKICNKIDAKLVHISTDYVFSGNSDKPYCEWDVCNPQSIYGKSKFLGEQYIKEQTNKYFIIRTSWLYGYIGHNFVKTIINLCHNKNKIKVVNDQLGNPTNANDLAHHILKIASTETYGIYHCTGPNIVSWYDFAQLIAKYTHSNCEIVPCSTDEFPRPAKRPKFSSLNNLMLKCTVGYQMRPWDDALLTYINNL